MDFSDVGIRHTILNSIQLHHFFDVSPSAAAVAKEARLCVIAIVVGWITTRIIASLISPNRDSVPGWNVRGEGHDPSFLSDKLILTPPYPGNTRGSAWAHEPITQQEWTAEFQFRASGPERAGGILQLWYTKDGEYRVGTSSIYTVGQFDGFALVIDTHGGRGGSVRGFLNDGTTNYKSHPSVDSLAFGHCDYSYRNLGRPSVVKLKHTNSLLEVTVDDKICFSTNKVALPAGNTFGITAATPENPDSFEVFKFVLESAAGQGQTIPSNQGSTPQQQQQEQQPIVNQDQKPPAVRDSGSAIFDAGITAQFVDLGGRIQLQNKAINTILQDVRGLAGKSEANHQELLQKAATKDQVTSLDARLQNIERLLQSIQRDLEGKDYSSRFNQLHDTLRSSHLSLTENIQGHLLSGKYFFLRQFYKLPTNMFLSS
ncbi:hypothetical protein N7462_005037 [Penicillium macrosclerotiorum]|uniref:uncharacterized protein n=1 Tax=Penicillium macrosclerotiorum TaxID=303699 RepID=UPI0025484F62|nr:uncharacterized protein N7462_005037 [Penicillium macrosclerotiorum]KAJ5690645.1 hypothetical protein N7462_005037 [Penicillium macrosclerotiorum]